MHNVMGSEVAKIRLQDGDWFEDFGEGYLRNSK